MVKIKAEILDILEEKNEAKSSKVEKDEMDAAGYGLRVTATEADLGSHINPDAAASTKQEHVDDYVGGSDEDGGVDRGKLSRGDVLPNGNKIVDPLGLLAPTNQIREFTPEVGQTWSVAG